ncbi:glycoside hydrolase family 127 protein [Sphingomonas sp. MS122]|uniref:glycoside hydrolase family 127 protein n=1 Tax=Sphingomonas sp. MS122 TaxID=3412683 RepID=UPI003C2C48D4
MPSISEPAQILAPPGAVTLGGVLGEALAANRHGRLSHFITDETSPAIAIFAPEAVAANEGGDWYGEHAGKWLAAAARAAARSGDKVLLGRVRRVADWLVARQAPDGYLGNYPPPRRFTAKHPPKPVSWNGEPSLRTWDIWTHAYLTLGLIELWRVTDGEDYLTAARKIGDLVWRTLSEDGLNITDMGNHFGLSATVMLDPALELYFATGAQRYLDLSLKIVAQAEDEPRNRLLSQALAGADPSEIATGKAYQLLWNLVGLAKLHRATGEERYLTAVRNLWGAVRDHHLTLGGGPWGGVAHRSREVFNPAAVFDPHGYVETCSTMAWIQLNRELLGLLGEARFAQEIERSAYNDLIGAQAPDGEDWCYYCFPNGRRVHTTYWRCCKSSGAMAIEELPAIAYATTTDGGIAINLLGPGEACFELPEAGRVRVRQDTDYPFHGEVEITVETDGPAEFLLRVRIPDWADDALVTIDGDAIAAPAGDYVRLDRRWQSGDRVVLSLPMRPTLLRATQRNVQESLAPDGAPVAQQVMRYDYLAITRGALVQATGLIDGYKLSETLRFDGTPEVEERDGALFLKPAGRAAIPFEPWFSAGGRRDGSWRLTWMQLAPEDAG